MKEAGFHDNRLANNNHTDWPLPRPLPHREGRDYRATPNVLLFVAYGVSCGCITRCPAQLVSLFYMP